MYGPAERKAVEALGPFALADPRSEPLFQSLAELAAMSFQAPTAVISLVAAGRHWIKAAVGVGRDLEVGEDGILAAVLRAPDVFVFLNGKANAGPPIPSLRLGGLDFRFLAGVPLATQDGVRLGTLCVADVEARTSFSGADVRRLQAIARSVSQAVILSLESLEREHIARVAAEQTTLLKLAEEMSGVGTWSWDVRLDRTIWSDQVFRIHGYDPSDEAPGLQGVLDRYHPDDAKVLQELVQAAVRDGKDYALEARIFHVDGSERRVIARGAARRDETGAVTSLVGTFQDITEHLTAERFIRAVADNLPGMVAYWDSDLRCRFANAAYQEWFGLSPETMIGTSLRDVLGAHIYALNEPHVRAALSGKPQLFPRTLVKPSGEVGHTWAHYIPDIDDFGRTQGFYVLVSDVTALKLAEEKLQETNRLLEAARDEAEAAAAVKGEFLANMSHEIRTPLTAIIGFADLLDGRKDLPETAQLAASRIRSASAALLAIVNDILDFSKLEAGEALICPRPVDVVALARETVTLFQREADVKSLQLDFTAAPSVPGRVLADPDRVRQILLNLLGNAVKFTIKGAVSLTLAYDAADEVLSARVSDTGPGMDDAQRARLFKRFSQVDGSSTRRHGGTGLGLAICKGLIEAMGGEIGVASEPGKGSTFHFKIPASPALSTVKAEDELSLGTLRGVRVLVADDNDANRDLARAILEQFEAVVREARDGVEAVDLASREPFDVVLLDLQMPRLDGVGAFNCIRSDPGPNKNSPVLAFTAGDLESAKMGRHAFDGVIGKPIAAGDLVSKLIAAARRHG